MCQKVELQLTQESPRWMMKRHKYALLIDTKEDCVMLLARRHLVALEYLQVGAVCVREREGVCVSVCVCVRERVSTLQTMLGTCRVLLCVCSSVFLAFASACTVAHEYVCLFLFRARARSCICMHVRP